ncbi:MAG: DUF3572 family protein [Alphaproteobacteria bacterium]|nr:MAG: DUF3572 family protein [Alphaproteobacteria bacterium]
MNRESAETVGLTALGWILVDAGRSADFLRLSGASAEDLRAGASDPAFLGFVLDFLLQSDDAVIDFCDENGLGYDIPARARRALPGGDAPGWT